MDAGERYEAWKEENLTTWQKKHWLSSELAQMQPDYEHPVLRIDEHGLIEHVKMPRCPATHFPMNGPKSHDGNTRCTNEAGYGTPHEGFGECYRHGGQIHGRLRRGAVLMALAYADELMITPWEALLQQLRLLANQVEWLRQRVHEYESLGGVDMLKPGGEGSWAVEMLEARGDRLAKVAKSCIDAGIAKQLVEGATREAENMAKAAISALDGLGIEGSQREEFLELMSREMLRLEEVSE